MPNGPDTEKAAERVVLEHVGILYAKSMVKLFAIVLITIQLALFNLLFAAIFLFIVYFTMPVRYYEDEPYKASEAWFRMGLGGVIAFFMLAALSPGGFVEVIGGIIIIAIIIGLAILAASSWITSKWLGILIMIGMLAIMGPILGIFGVVSPAFSIFFLTMAFFCTPANPAGRREGMPQFNIAIATKIKNAVIKGKGENLKAFADGLFLSLAIAGGIPLLTWFSIGGGPIPVGTIFVLIIWIFSLLVGFAAREGRPYIGVLIVGVAMLAFSYQFTGTVGTALFGPWWATVEHYTSIIASPIGQAFESASQGISDAWLLMTCPSCYYAHQLEKQRATETKIEVGGTSKAIEITDFYTVLNVIDWNIPFTGQLMIANQGEYVGTDVTIRFEKPKLKSAEESSIEKGEQFKPLTDCLDTYDIECMNPTSISDKGCTWDEIEPNGLKLVKFKIKFQTTGCDQYGGQFATLNFTLDYDYRVDVRQNLRVMNSDILQTKLLNKEITQKQERSEYKGGPLTVGIWTLKQPLASEDEIPVVLTAIRKSGISNVNYRLTVPDSFLIQCDSTVCSINNKDGKPWGASRAEGNDCYVECFNIDFSKETGVAAKYANIKYDIGDAPEKTFVLTGHAIYHYETFKEGEYSIGWVSAVPT